MEIDEILSLGDALNMKFRLEFAENHKKLTLFFIIMSLCSPFIGWFLLRKAGLLIGFFVGMFLFILGPFFYCKIIEIRKFRALTKDL